MADPLRLDNQLCFALHAASRAMTRAYQPLLDELGITYPQYLVLLTLWEEDGGRVSRIGERLYLDSATLTPLLKRLEARGLIDRRRSAVDERVVEVFLTAEGKRLRRRAEAVPRAAFGKTGLSTVELGRLRAALQDLTRTLLDATATATAPRSDRS
jgi:MarR family transcriptional regulator, organic hydroperoxide resistance regulator